VEQNPAITWIVDAEGVINYVNPRLAEYIGAEPPRTMDAWAERFLHPDDIPVRQQAWERARTTGEPYDVELRIRRHDGAYHCFLSRAVPVRDEAGRVVEWMGTSTDIQALKRSEENLRLLADAGLALAEVGDIEGTMRRISNLAVPRFSDWCEVTLREGTGVRRLGIVHGDPARIRMVEDIDRRFPRGESSVAAQVIRTGETVFTPHIDDEMLRNAAVCPEHLELLRGLKLKSFICSPIASKEGVLGAITFATSESARTYSSLDCHVADELARRAGAAVENSHLLQALTDADRRKDEFLAVLAHELRNPLAPVRNAVEILRAIPSPSPQLQWTQEVIDRQVRQMSRLVDDLLDVSRIARGKITLKRERVDLSDAIRLALETSRPLIERGGHEFTLRLKPERLTVEGDLARLAQIISNLLNNAARYTPPGGHIWLSAGRSGTDVEVCVGDNGIGIEPRMRERIFEMFAQGGGDRGASHGGLGIGLTLVKRLVEMHGGTVEVRSPGVGRGSDFFVRLPLAAGEVASNPPGSTASGKEATMVSKRILVVDDNRDAADSLSMLLGGQGHEVRTAYDGLEAVGSAVAFDPDVVLMDIGLPKLYGYEAAKRIRQARGDSVLLVAITGWGQEEDRRRSREAGFDFHLTKPVDPEAIARLINDGRPRA
jgi:PAS domain S-box-containing protein